MVAFLIFVAIVGFVYWRLVKTNGDFTPQERYLTDEEIEREQIVIYVQPRKGEPLERAV